MTLPSDAVLGSAHRRWTDVPVERVADGIERQMIVGARVMVHHYTGCTQCSHCRSGWQQLCQEVPVKVYGSNAHGGHAQYLRVPADTPTV